MSLSQPQSFGAQCPWFGPLFARFGCVVNTGMIGFSPGEYDLVGYVWTAEGELVATRALRICRSMEAVDIDVHAAFPEARGIDGTLGLLLSDRTDPSRVTPVTWISRFYRGDGTLVTVVSSSAPRTINYPEKTGRALTYRMTSSQLMRDGGWRSASWHGNVSANASYSKSLRLFAVAYNASGEKLEAPAIVVPPFGSRVIDLHAIFGDGLEALLAGGDGRGSATVFSPDGGAVGYHFLLNPSTQDIALDHTRPALHYLESGYGDSWYLSDVSPLNFARAAFGVLRFRAREILGGLRP